MSEDGPVVLGDHMEHNISKAGLLTVMLHVLHVLNVQIDKNNKSLLYDSYKGVER